MTNRILAAGTAALLTAALLGACSTSQEAPAKTGNDARTAPTPALQSFYSQTPDWADCGEGFECAKVKVPLDYAKPSGEQIEISAIRLPASGERMGSLFINPGGPGASGIEYTRAAPFLFTDDLRARFDIVGFDPRGVGESAPVRCMSSQELDSYVGLDGSPDTPGEIAAQEKGSKSFADACQAKSGSLLPFVGTANAARDMDVLRGVVGDTGLTYLGKSYGTYLGALYADLFPKRVRALVLDGAVDPAVSSFSANKVQAQGFEVALKAFTEDCLRANGCPFTSRTVDGAMAEVAGLLQKADERPLRNDLGDGRVIGEAWTVLGIVTPLYDHQQWPRLRAALGQAFKGNGSDLLRMADVLVDRGPNGVYSNQTESNMAINCVDHPYPKGTATYEKAAVDAAKAAPHFGSFVMWGSFPCSFWPVKAAGADGADSVKPLKAEGAPPILVVGTVRDPATPYEWAKGLASELSSGVLLGYDGDGHTAYRTGSACVDKAVDDYLISLQVPKKGMVCPEA
ncbi:alpha/beta hydrolase [Planotetraspora phitsanulokensis]|uniref:Proteinase n=1 Tax=Planotetraspora phitsanulokensis TaxID=575192 RepID=A0A8J3U8W6_9ACTN|nr:alpha/beta hydrolase [Planotetraspora phitsanulokensis]GII39222.1 proteinase [Planotetraspora phitsanulokensis]